MDDFDFLLDTLGRDETGFFGFGISVNATCFGGFPCDGDVATVDVSVEPAAFQEGFEGGQTAGDDGEDDEEDAGAGVGAAGGRGPLVGEEGGIVGVHEDH